MTEPGTGSDLAGISTRAVKDSDSYILNGSKTFITNGTLADALVVAAKTDPTAGAKGLSLFVVERDTPGFARSKPIKKIGYKAQDTTELYFENCRIATANLLGKEGAGFGYLAQELQQERLAHLAAARAERAAEITTAYVKERTAFGKPINKFQNTQFTLAECATRAQIMRTFIYTLILNHMQGKDILQEVSMAKYYVCETTQDIASKCLQLHGGYGYCEEYEISQIWTGLRMYTIVGGTSEIMKMLVARGLGL